MFTAVVIVADGVYQSHTVVSEENLENHLAQLESDGVDSDDIIQSSEEETEEEVEAWVAEMYPESAGFEDTEGDDDVEEGDTSGEDFDEEEEEDDDEDEDDDDEDEDESDDDDSDGEDDRG